MAQQANRIGAAVTCYPVSLQVVYKLNGRTGGARTLSMSSAVVRLARGELLPTRQQIELSIEWPVFLNGKVGLRLCIKGNIIESSSDCTSVEILRYEFRTKGLNRAGDTLAIERLLHDGIQLAHDGTDLAVPQTLTANPR